MKILLQVTSDDLAEILGALKFRRDALMKSRFPIPVPLRLIDRIDKALHAVKCKEGEQFITIAAEEITVMAENIHIKKADGK